MAILYVGADYRAAMIQVVLEHAELGRLKSGEETAGRTDVLIATTHHTTVLQLQLDEGGTSIITLAHGMGRWG